MSKKSTEVQVTERVAVWLPAYNAIREELTPQTLRDMFKVIIGATAPTTPEEALTVLQSSMALAQLISANDRAAAMVAANVTQYVKTSAVDYEA